MKKRIIVAFAVLVFSAVFINASEFRQTGPAEAVAGKNCGVNHTNDTDHDGHVQKTGSPDKKKAGSADTHNEHDGHHQKNKKADEEKNIPVDTGEKHNHDLHQPDARKHDDHDDDHPGHDQHKDSGRQDAHQGHTHDGHTHGAGGLDLDRSIDELWTAKCEHDILHYTCDECRYELGVVKLSDKVFKNKDNAGLVSVMPVVRQDFSKPLHLPGEVAMNDSRTVRVSSPVQGTVARFSADIGQIVEPGQILCEIDSIEAAEAKGDFLKKSAALTLARKAAEREASLFAKKISAEAEVLEAKNRQTEAEIELANARAKLFRLGFSEKDISSIAARSPGSLSGTLPLYAPCSGRVIERYSSIGERVEAGKEMLLLSDLAEVWVWADIRETDLHLMPDSGRLNCEVGVPGSPGRKYSGTLEAITGIINEQTRTVRARIAVANTDGRLRPGMFVNVTVHLKGPKNVLAVPQVALLTDMGRDFVFVHKEGDYWIRRPVEKGDSFGGYVAIQDGLVEGQKIISDGSFLLKSDVLRSKMGAGCAD